MTITLGWWLLPLLITVSSLLWALYWPTGYDTHEGFADPLVRFVRLLWALGGSLVVWLIYFIIF